MKPSVTVKSLSDFTDFVDERCSQSELNFFRGQRQDWPLLPKIARIRLAGDDVLKAESDMLKEFRRASRPLVRSPLVGLWDVVALAQHHGLPTRLLDWTSHALAALWFAVAEPNEGMIDRVVWMYQPSYGDLIDESVASFVQVKHGMVLEPSHVTPRITAQGGVFTVTRFNKRTQKFVPLTATQAIRKKLTKILIKHDEDTGIRWNLERCGIHAFSLFPDLDGLARQVERGYSWLSDEEDPIP